MRATHKRDECSYAVNHDSERFSHLAITHLSIIYCKIREVERFKSQGDFYRLSHRTRYNKQKANPCVELSCQFLTVFSFEIDVKLRASHISELLR